MHSPAHRLIQERKIVLVAGVYDALSAKLAERAGFHSVAVTGYGVSAALMPFAEFTALLGLEEKYQLDEKYRV